MKKQLLGAAILGATLVLGATSANAQQDGAARMAAMFPDPNKDGATEKAEMLAASDARFSTIDTDKDGKLSAAEIGAAQGGRMLSRADTDGDGQVTLAEVRATTATRFDRIDANKDGKIDKAEKDIMLARMQQMRPGN